MKRILHFWLVGGDLRQHWLGRQLAEDGHFVHLFGLAPELLKEGPNLIWEENLDHAHQGDCVVLPLPLCNKEGQFSAPFHSTPLTLQEIFKHLSPHQQIFAGQVSPLAKAMAEEAQLTIQDYFARDELTIANAVPTAEGCIQIALERLSITLHETNVLVLGYGKVATATASRLGALGANVTIAARKYSQLEQARCDGFHTDHIHQLVGALSGYHCIVNTVPALVLGEKELADIEPSALIIDLASGAGGVDQEAARTLHRSLIQALSLPGKVAPASAGLAIKRTLYHMLEEQSMQKGR